MGSELIRQIEKSAATAFNGAANFVRSLSKRLTGPLTQPSPLHGARGRGKRSTYMPLEHSPRAKKAIPAGVWTKCDKCEQIIYNKELEENLKICPKCGAHFRINARERMKQLFDEGSFKEFGEYMRPDRHAGVFRYSAVCHPHHAERKKDGTVGRLRGRRRPPWRGIR